MRSGFALGLALGLTAGPALALEPWRAEDAVRACPQFGPGFIAVPGSSTCVKISGRVVAEYGTRTSRNERRVDRRDDAPGFSSRGRITLDSRTETDYGPIRLLYRADVGQGRPLKP